MTTEAGKVRRYEVGPNGLRMHREGSVVAYADYEASERLRKESDAKWSALVDSANKLAEAAQRRADRVQARVEELEKQVAELGRDAGRWNLVLGMVRSLKASRFEALMYLLGFEPKTEDGEFTELENEVDVAIAAIKAELEKEHG